MCRFQEKLQQRAKEGKPVFEDYRWIRNPSDTSTLETEEEKRCLKDVVSLLSFFVQENDPRALFLVFTHRSHFAHLSLSCRSTTFG